MNRKLVCTIIFCALSFFLCTSRVFAISNGGIGILPVNEDESADAPQTFSYTIDPGGRVFGEVEISNSNSFAVDVLVYSADAIFNNDGQLSCEQRAENKNSEGSWIQVDGENYILEPYQKKKVKFIISVPKEVNVGEHNACLVMQKKENKVAEDPKQGISLRIRIALRVKITIPGDVKKDVSITKFEHLYDEDKSTLYTTFENSGNVSVGGNYKLDTKFFGLIPVQKVREQIVILRDAKLVRSDVRERPFYGGLYFAEAEFDYTDQNQSQVFKNANLWYWIWPEWWFIVLLSLIGAGIGVYFYQKRKKKKSTGLKIKKIKREIKTWGKVSKK